MSTKTDYLWQNKKSVWYYIRKVPVDVRAVIGGGQIMKSLKTTDKAIAAQKAGRMNLLYEGEWAHVVTVGEERDANIFNLAIKKAQNLNVTYMESELLLVARNFDEVSARVSFLKQSDARADDIATTALLGVVDEPVVKVSDAETLFFDKIMAQRKASLSDSKYRVWRNRYLRSIKQFIDLNGDMPMNDIERRHGVIFYDYWLARVMGENGRPVKAATASKEVGTMSAFYDRYFRYIEGVGGTRINPFRGLNFEGMEDETRPPFSIKAIKEMLISDKLLKLNFEARMIFLAFIDTGARPTELCGLEADDIVLDGDVPYINIVPRAARQLKTKDGSKRVVPLVGVALEAFKRFPKGFKKYKFNELAVCAIAGKFIRVNGFKESSAHTFYSIRHSFMDRMEMAGLEQEFRHRMLGHKLKNEEYGKGGELAFKHDKLKAIELDFNKKLFKKS